MSVLNCLKSWKQRSARSVQRRRLYAIPAFCLMTLLTGAALVEAQTLDVGLQPYHVYQGGNIDYVNLDNGGLTVTIPLVSYPQRGSQLKMSFALVLSGPQTSGNTTCINVSINHQRVKKCTMSWTDLLPNEFNLLPVSSPGVALVDTQELRQRLVSIPMISTVDVGYPDCVFGECWDNPPDMQNTGGYTSQTLWLTPDGGIHASGQLSNGQIALDGSGYQNGITYAVNQNGIQGIPTCHWLCSLSGLEAVKNGVAYFTPGSGPSVPTGNIVRQDADGNYISRSSTQYTDTTGRAIPLPQAIASPTSAQIASCGGPLPVVQIASWEPPGYSSPFLFCFANVTIALPYSVAVVPTSMTYSVNSSTQEFLQDVVLPNGQKWQFEYAESFTTYDKSGQVVSSNLNMGDLTGITFPTGGTIAYTWQMSTNKEYPPDGTAIATYVQDRAVDANDGNGSKTWTYTYGGGYSAPGVTRTSTVTDPLGNVVSDTITFGVANSTDATRVMTTQDSSGHVLKTVTTTYPWQYSTWTGFPLYPSSEVTTLDDGEQSLKTFTICCDINYLYSLSTGGPYANGYFTWASSNGKVVDEKDYDFGSGGHGALLREAATSYEFQSNTNYYNSNGENPGFFDLPAEQSIYNGSGTLLAKTDYQYDGSSLHSSGISTQIETPWFSVGGHLTDEIDWLNVGAPNPSKATTYYDTGEVYQSFDADSHPTTYNYSATYGGALPTTVTNALNQSTTMTYDAATGKIASEADPNGNQTSYSYNDPMSRLTNVSYPDTGGTSYQYSDTGTLGVTISQVGHSDSLKVNVDGLGREYETVDLNFPGGTVYTRTKYDSLGRKYQVWNPTRCDPMNASSCSSETTWGITTFSYDALGRKTSQLDSDGTSSQSWAYSGNSVSYFDEDGNEWQRYSDASGNLTKVLEPNGTSQSPSMETDYSYDALGNLLQVDQYGGSKGNSQYSDHQRKFTYDSLSRLIQAYNPESGWVCYGTTPGYNGNLAGAAPNGTNCTSGYDSNGNLLYKTDARAVTIAYSYDALNRLLSRNYTAPSSAPAGYAATAPVSYTYDQGSASANPIGRRTGMTDSAGSESWTYDKMGRFSQINRTTVTPISTQSGYAAYSYNPDGSLNAARFFTGTYYQYAYDSVGRQTGLIWNASGGPFTYASNGTYDPTGHLTGLTIGGSNSIPAVTISNQFNNRLQPVVLSASTAASTVMSHALCYANCYSGAPTTNNGNILSDTDYVDASYSSTYAYDTLNRLKSAQASVWGDAYTYDPFGNLYQMTPIGTGTGFTLTATPNALNRLDAIGLQYDADGNVITDSNNVHYTYDAEGRIASAGSWTYEYDGDGNRVLSSGGGSTGNVYWYAADGTLSDESTVGVNPTSLASNPTRYFYINGQLIVTAPFPGSPSVVLHDQIGSTRVTVDTSGAAHDTNYFPFGAYVEPPTDTLEQRFTGKERDSESGNDYFSARYYGSSMGRFLSPDPSGGHTEDPQTLNKYSYVGNNPLIRTDPTGLDFNLQCSGGNTATCQNGIQGTTATDANGKSTFTATVISNDKNGGLVDRNGNAYTATVSGAGVSFSQAGSSQSSIGTFINGTTATTIQGSGALAGFTFNFTSSNIAANVNASGTFTYSGTADQAQAALQSAGFQHYTQDQYLDPAHWSTSTYTSYDMRSPGGQNGSNAGHVVVQDPVQQYDVWTPYGYQIVRVPIISVPTRGSLDLGDTNPWVPGGFMQHFREYLIWKNSQ